MGYLSSHNRILLYFLSRWMNTLSLLAFCIVSVTKTYFYLQTLTIPKVVNIAPCDQCAQHLLRNISRQYHPPYLGPCTARKIAAQKVVLFRRASNSHVKDRLAVGATLTCAFLLLQPIRNTPSDLRPFEPLPIRSRAVGYQESAST